MEMNNYTPITNKVADILDHLLVEGWGSPITEYRNYAKILKQLSTLILEERADAVEKYKEARQKDIDSFNKRLNKF